MSREEEQVSEIEGMVREGRLPMNDAELAAIDALLAEHGEEAVQSFTRSEPGETGLLHVTIGDAVYEVSEDGTVSTP
jgi:hypothetical protein